MMQLSTVPYRVARSTSWPSRSPRARRLTSPVSGSVSDCWRTASSRRIVSSTSIAFSMAVAAVSITCRAKRRSASPSGGSPSPVRRKNAPARSPRSENGSTRAEVVARCSTPWYTGSDRASRTRRASPLCRARWISGYRFRSTRRSCSIGFSEAATTVHRSRLVELLAGAQLGADPGQQFPDPERLAHHVRGAEPEGPHRRFLRRGRGEHHHRQVAMGRLLADGLQQREAVLPREGEVEQDQVHRVGGEILEEAVAAEERARLVAVLPEQPRQRPRERLVVVHDEDLRRQRSHVRR